MKYEQMTTNEFHKLIDELEDTYSGWIKIGFDGSILEFLDHEIGEREYYKDRINPIDVIRELHKCNMKNDIFDETYDGTYLTNRFKILMGICECIEYCNRPKPKFNTNDICFDTTTSEGCIVLYFKDETYYCKKLNGFPVVFTKKDFESSHKKIGVAVDESKII